MNMNSIFNLTQHDATPEQIADRVVERGPEMRELVRSLLTFDHAPRLDVIRARALTLATIAEMSGHGAALIGGAPYLMSSLERALLDVSIYPLYAFSTRDVMETAQSDGTVIKTSVFKHDRFIVAYYGDEQ